MAIARWRLVMMRTVDGSDVVEEIQGDGYVLVPEPDGSVLVKIDGGPWFRVEDGGHRDEKRSNLLVAEAEAVDWVNEARTLRLGAEPKHVTRRRADAHRRVLAAMRLIGLPRNDAEAVALDASEIAVDPMFADLPIRFTCLCASYIAGWDHGLRPSLSLSTLCKALGAKATTMRKTEKKTATGYLPDARPIMGTEGYEVLLWQGGRPNTNWWR